MNLVDKKLPSLKSLVNATNVMSNFVLPAMMMSIQLSHDFDCFDMNRNVKMPTLAVRFFFLKNIV